MLVPEKWLKCVHKFGHKLILSYIWKIYILIVVAMVHTLDVPPIFSNLPPIETLGLYVILEQLHLRETSSNF